MAKWQGIILAGGQSKRFGSDKALALIDGQTLLDRAVGKLRALDLPVTLVTHPDRPYKIPGTSVLTDTVPNQGPLGGLRTAFEHFLNTNLLVLTCDMPYLEVEALRNLIHAHEANRYALATIFAREEQTYLQPFPGIYRSLLLEQVNINLSIHQRSMQDFLAHVETLMQIPYEGSPAGLHNLNEVPPEID